MDVSELTVGTLVTHRSRPGVVLRVTDVDPVKPRVCCAWKSAPDTWQHENFKPEELERVE